MPRDKDDIKQVGVLIVFPEGITKEQADRMVDKMLDTNDINGFYTVNEFNPRWGHPVWYIP